MDGNSSGTVAPEQIIINGQEYSLEDASQLIELGNKWKETESKLNTSLDKVYPKYTETAQRAKELEEQLAERNRMIEELQTKKPEVPEDKAQTLKAARELGLADQDWLVEQGYVRKTDLDSYFTEKQSQQKLVDNVLQTANQLEKEIDGSDGRVPFDQKAVLAYASAYNISDLKDAYEQMNERANARWKEAQIAKSERPGLKTMTPGGKKSPEKVRVTDDNFSALWDELTNGVE